MTIQEARNKVALWNGHGDWLTLVFRENLTSVLLLDVEAAELYGDSQYNQALEDALKILSSDEALTNPHFKYSEELKRLKR